MNWINSSKTIKISKNPVKNFYECIYALACGCKCNKLGVYLNIKIIKIAIRGNPATLLKIRRKSFEYVCVWILKHVNPKTTKKNNYKNKNVLYSFESRTLCDLSPITVMSNGAYLWVGQWLWGLWKLGVKYLAAIMQSTK